MRKYFLIFISCILFLIFILLILFGLKIGPLKIYSYNDIITMSIEEKNLINEVDTKTKEYNSNIDKKLNAANTKLDAKKNKYNQLKSTNKLSINSIVSYDIDDIWSRLKDFALEKSVTVDMNLEKNADFEIDEYKFENYNLNFVCSGDYINLTDFIYAIEDNDELGFEISNFSMENENGNLVLKFSLNNILVKVK